MVDQIDSLKKEIDELTFENSTIRKDMRELTGTLKDYQEKEFRHKQLEQVRLQAEQQAKIEFERQLDSLEHDRAKTLEERKRGEALKAAYNADRKAMTDRIADLETEIRSRD